jgi:ubiquinone/menaquinone biosynthesis C-methylase UbiE
MTEDSSLNDPAPPSAGLLKTAYVGKGASTYDSVRFTTRHGLAFDALEREEVLRAAALIAAGDAILEVGCGTARFSVQLARMGYRVTGTDASPDMLRIAEEKGRGLTNLDLRLQEGARLGFDNDAFDFVFAVRVMNSLESSAYALKSVREMIRVARPGGYILIEFANGDRPFARRNNSVRLTFRELEALAKEQRCTVARRSGVLVLSQTVLNSVPGPLLSLWMGAERALAAALWRVASRGYILLRKGVGA